MLLKNKAVPCCPNILQRTFNSAHQKISNRLIQILDATFVTFFAAAGFMFQKDGTYLLRMLFALWLQEELSWPDDDPEKPSKTSSQAALQQHAKPGTGIEWDHQADLKELVVSNENKASESKARPSEKSDAISHPFERSNMANLFEAYSGNDDKYSGGTANNFERKFLLFLERYDLADISSEDRHRAFSNMLSGHIGQFYFDSLKRNERSLDELEAVVKRRF